VTLPSCFLEYAELSAGAVDLPVWRVPHIHRSHGSSWETLASFLKGFSIDAASSGCYNISLQLPAGANATVSSGDWSGVGSGADSSSWDLETCSLLIERISTNNVTDMFLPRAFTLE
jgi:hypothetical protein